ncbi:tetratricopeptide repeat protein [Paeniglutamicibacter sp. NPDC091659]|uniref:tetratricopeptide repeat protein n=1 Tax=Paeniglutamicibacter sp. NPDC091659 TaxID=3364389 RepID=UPI0037F67091
MTTQEMTHELTHTQELLRVPASAAPSATHNIESGIPGVRFDPQSMSQTISDEALADETMARGNAAEQVVVLLARGHVRAASELVAETRFMEPQNFAMRVLDTSLTRASGDPQRAANRLRALLTEFDGTAHESVLQQHLGMAYVESGDLRAAATRFRKALDLRIAEGADERLVDSSRRCLEALTARLETLAPQAG